MRNSATEHPSDPMLVAYSFGRAKAVDLAWIEEHLLVCESCRSVVAEADAFAGLSRARLERGVRVAAGYRHMLRRGALVLVVERLGSRKCLARISGAGLDEFRTFATLPAAYGYLHRLATSVLGNHECSERCGVHNVPRAPGK